MLTALLRVPCRLESNTIEKAIFTQNCLLRHLVQTKKEKCLGRNLQSHLAATETLSTYSQHFIVIYLYPT